MNNAKMKCSARNFEEFLEMCREEFNCSNSSPGEERVTFLKLNLFYVFYVSFYKYSEFTAMRE
jgi:hypothetical protein